MSVNYVVPGIKQVYAQPNTMACWATVYAMMYSWNSCVSPASVRDAIAPLGQPWLGYFDRNTGIPPSEGRNFEAATGLIREPRMNLTARGWEDMLRRHGLLWVSGVVPGGIHDRILEGISGDESTAGTRMHIMDPDGGRRYQENFRTFLRGFEAQAAVEPFHEDYQILHFR